MACLLLSQYFIPAAQLEWNAKIQSSSVHQCCFKQSLNNIGFLWFLQIFSLWLSAEQLPGTEVPQRGQRQARTHCCQGMPLFHGVLCWSLLLEHNSIHTSYIYFLGGKKDLFSMQKSSCQMLLTVVIFLVMSCGFWHRFWVQEFKNACQYQYEIFIYSSIHRSWCCWRDKIHNVVNDPAICSCSVS